MLKLTCISDRALSGRTGSIPKQAKDWVFDTGRIVESKRSTNRGKELFVRVLLRDLSALEFGIPSCFHVRATLHMNISCMLAFEIVQIGPCTGRRDKEGKCKCGVLHPVVRKRMLQETVVFVRCLMVIQIGTGLCQNQRMW